jgi:hypothetical protein
MVVRKKNLLDAFREAAPEGRRASADSPPSSPAGGPFAAPARTSAPSAEPAAGSGAARTPPSTPEARESATRIELPSGPSTLEQALADKTLRAVVAIAALIALGAFLAGRMSHGDAAAAEPAASNAGGPGILSAGGAGSAGRDLAEKNLAAAKMGTEDDRAFMDPANKYTIQLIQYDNTESNLERAHATAEHLRRKERLPIVGPIARGKFLVLAAGHTPKIADLADLLAHVKGLAGPPPQEKMQPFASAYVVNIDDVVKRD